MLLDGLLFFGLSAVVMGEAMWVGAQRARRRIAWETRLGQRAAHPSGTPQAVQTRKERCLGALESVNRLMHDAACFERSRAIDPAACGSD